MVFSMSKFALDAFWGRQHLAGGPAEDIRHMLQNPQAPPPHHDLRRRANGNPQQKRYAQVAPRW
eukprot:3939347-Pyramimonas_sp.AAC.1